VLLLAGALLRFRGLDHDLDFVGGAFDESNNFVDPALRLWRQGTLEPMP
jgi:hypothetical protein